MAEKPPWEMNVPADAPPWEAGIAPADPEAAPVPPSRTASEAAARGLKNFTFGERLGGLAEFGLDVGMDAAGTVYGAMRGPVAAAGGVFTGEGAVPAYVRGVREGQEAFDYNPRLPATPEVGEEIAELGEGAVKAIKFMAGTPAAMATFAAGGGPQEALYSMRQFRDEPFAERVFRSTGSPGAAAAATIAPDVATIGVGGMPGTRQAVSQAGQQAMRPVRAAGRGAAEGIRAGMERTGMPQAPRRQITATEAERLRQAVINRDNKTIAQIINGNPAVVEAFDELGIEFRPAMVSQSPDYRLLETGTKAAPESGIAGVDDRVQRELIERAEDFVNETSTVDRSVVAADVADEFDSIRTQLDTEESSLWERLRTRINPDRAVDLEDIADEVEVDILRLGNGDIERGLQRARELNRRDLASLYELTHIRRRVPDPEDPTRTVTAWEYDSPTYFAVDEYRKTVGAGLNNTGRFSDAETGQLRLRYGQIADRLGRVADREGYGELYQRANALTETRKNLEQSMDAVQGREGRRGILASIDQAANEAVKGNVGRFEQLIENTPESQRASVATQVLSSMFRPGSQKSFDMTAGFVKNWEALNRNTRVKDRIFAELPEEARASWDRLGNAASGFYEAISTTNWSGTEVARQSIEAIKKGTFLQRILGAAASTGRRIPAFGSIFGDEIRAIEKGESRFTAASRLLASPALRQATRLYARGDTAGADRVLEESNEWKDWAREMMTARPEYKGRLGIAFLFGADQETEDE